MPDEKQRRKAERRRRRQRRRRRRRTHGREQNVQLSRGGATEPRRRTTEQGPTQLTIHHCQHHYQRGAGLGQVADSRAGGTPSRRQANGLSDRGCRDRAACASSSASVLSTPDPYGAAANVNIKFAAPVRPRHPRLIGEIPHAEGDREGGVVLYLLHSLHS